MRPSTSTSTSTEPRQTRAPAQSKRKQANPRQVPKVDREIHRLQQSTDMLLQRAPFCRVVREILMRLSPHDEMLRVQSNALLALQEAAEMYLTQLMEDAYRCTLHRDRVTLQPKDMRLARFLRGAGDPGNQ